MLKIRVETKGNVAIVHCAGRMVVGEELTRLRDAVFCALDKTTILLDLAEVETIDAGGLGLLVFLHTCAHGLGNDLAIAPSAQVEMLLELTKLDQVFKIGSDAETSRYPAPRSQKKCCEACA
jgi:anti-anti-sigma factor